jgi:hypothetical protein
MASVSTTMSSKLRARAGNVTLINTPSKNEIKRRGMSNRSDEAIVEYFPG